MKELSAEMVAFLLDCRQREQQKLEPAGKGRFTKDLLDLGLIKAAWYAGKGGKIQRAYFITAAGKQFLQKHTLLQ